jgi:signal transduction histidine kinase
LCAFAVVLCAAGIQAYRLRVQRRVLRLEQQAALQRERARIAQDMHDDLGAKLTKIAFLSEVAKRQAANYEQLRSTARSISDMARNVIDNISEIVWVTNPRNDSLDNVASYLREYAADYFDSTPIRCDIDFPERIPASAIKGEVRRDVLLVFKEALNNVAKHSGASTVTIILRVEPMESGQSRLEITVSDNGRGLKTAEPGTTNDGLRNMRARIDARGGNLRIESTPNGGTTLELTVVCDAVGGGKASTTFM